MNEVKMINKNTILSEKRIPSHDELVNIVTPSVNLGANEKLQYKQAEMARKISDDGLVMTDNILKYGSAFDIPVKCHTLDKTMSVREMRDAGLFKPSMSSNTLPNDWQSMWDAMRIDISISKISKGNMRGAFYNIQNNPDADKIISIDEFFPYGIVFEENTGEGQSVTKGETFLGQTDTMEHLIYAAGFDYTLLAALFDKSLDMQKLSNAVILAEDAKKNDLSLSPIINETYSGAQQTAADTKSGASRQELLYNTLANALDDISQREDPVTGRKIDASDLRILCSPLDARHIETVIGGFDIQGQDEPKNLGSLAGSFSQIVAYDGDVINMRAKTITYSGVTDGTIYIVKPNRYMNISIKRNLTLEVDPQPNVMTLSQEERAWYFVEGQYNEDGLDNFVQEVTLPTW
jgi:hypothetical protein